MEAMKEIRIMSRFDSEYVVKYYNSWTEGKVIDKELKTFVYIQMELCEQNLQTIIKLINDSFNDRFKVIKFFIRTQLFKKIIECLNYLHSLNPPIIHRDLKPQNILVTDATNGNFLKLCDFGLSKVFENSQNTKGVGSPKFIAPEVYESDSDDDLPDKSKYGLKSDIYSLGVIATKLFDLKDGIKTIRKLKCL